jgi:predicted unusual protein kinase regulating ubiquinone biosynthesis (AarF/ABC1/UbiB family)
LGKEIEDIFDEFTIEPVASASIAQVKKNKKKKKKNKYNYNFMIEKLNFFLEKKLSLV